MTTETAQDLDQPQAAAAAALDFRLTPPHRIDADLAEGRRLAGLEPDPELEARLDEHARQAGENRAEIERIRAGVAAIAAETAELLAELERLTAEIAAERQAARS